MNCGTVDKSTCALEKKRAFKKTSEKINVSENKETKSEKRKNLGKRKVYIIQKGYKKHE